MAENRIGYMEFGGGSMNVHSSDVSETWPGAEVPYASVTRLSEVADFDGGGSMLTRPAEGGSGTIGSAREAVDEAFDR
jgi:hypothetical protein